MKYTLMTAAVAATMLFASCVDNKNTQNSPAANSKGTMSVAYVNIDTLTEHLEFFKANKTAFEKEEQSANDEINRMANALQNEYIAFQKKAQAGNVSQQEGEQTQARLGRQQQNLEEKRQQLSAEFLKKQEDFNKELKKRLDDYLETFNKDRKYSLILSHGTGSQILWVDTTMDITKAVIKGMNEEGSKLGNEVKPAADSAKK